MVVSIEVVMALPLSMTPPLLPLLREGDIERQRGRKKKEKKKDRMTDRHKARKKKIKIK